jgi:hypothetical protein
VSSEKRELALAEGTIDDAGDERREHHRYQLRLPVNVRFEGTGRWSSAVLMDLSAGGVLLRTSARSIPGNTIYIKFQRYEGKFELAGSVVRAPCIPPPGGFAVKFLPGTPGLDELLAAVAELPHEERAAYLAGELRPFIEVKGG